MKVLHVSPYFFPAHIYGGPIQSVYQLCLHTAALGVDVRVLTTDANGIDRVLQVQSGKDLDLGGGVRVRYCRRFGNHSFSPSLLRSLPAASQWADVVHLTAVYSFPTIPTLLFARLMRKPVVWSPRGALQRWEGSTRIRAKAVWERACLAVAPPSLLLHVTSEAEAVASANRLRGVAQVVIPNGVEVPAAADRGPRSESLRMLYLGRVHPIKAIDHLLAACELLATTDPMTWSLTVAGAGEPRYVDTLSAEVARAGLSDRVSFVGHATEQAKRRLFACSDVLVLPSHTENFGMVAAEALTHTVPVIASKGTPWQRVEEVGCGLWVDNDPASLAEAIRRIARMPLVDMGARGRSWMEREFSWRSIAQQMNARYNELLKR